MKVFQINTTINTGSTGRIAEDIGKTVLAAGHESYIAGSRCHGNSASKVIQVGNRFDLLTHVLYTRLFDRHSFVSRGATKKLIRHLEEINPDIIGLHNLHGYYLNIELLFNYLKSIQKPVVWTLHDCWPFTGHCTYFDSVGCEKWKTECSQCPKVRMYPASFWLDASKKNFVDKKKIFSGLKLLRIVSPSLWLKDILSRSFLAPYSVEVINNGIDLQLFRPFRERIKSRQKKIVLGVASTWDDRKGLKDFIRLATILSSEYQILLVGLSKKQVNELPSNIEGVERTENSEQLAAYYSMAYVFVNLTYQDNFPTTNLEALASGTPVITYDTGGSPEAIDDHTGFVVKKGEIATVASIITQISSEKRETFSHLCRARAEQRFGKNDRYFDYIHLYESMWRNSMRS